MQELKKTDLITSLREMLDATSRGAQLEAQAKEAEDVQNTLESVPMTIYVG